jgi:hypothetical protein
MYYCPVLQVERSNGSRACPQGTSTWWSGPFSSPGKSSKSSELWTDIMWWVQPAVKTYHPISDRCACGGRLHSDRRRKEMRSDSLALHRFKLTWTHAFFHKSLCSFIYLLWCCFLASMLSWRVRAHGQIRSDSSIVCVRGSGYFISLVKFVLWFEYLNVEHYPYRV